MLHSYFGTDSHHIVGSMIVALCIVCMLVILLHLSYVFYLSPTAKVQNRKMKLHENLRHRTQSLQRLTCFCAIITALLCSAVDLVKLVSCYRTNGRIIDTNVYNAMADFLLFASSLLLYVRLIYFRLHVPFQQSMYAYSTCSLLVASIPMVVSAPCMLLYLYGFAKYAFADGVATDEWVKPYALVIMLMDLALNVITYNLFAKQLKRLIMDGQYQDFVKANAQEVRVSFGGTHVENTVNVIGRYFVLSLAGTLFNQIYYVLMALWIFVWQQSDVLGAFVCAARGLNNVVAAAVQYLLFYHHTKKVYHMLCGVCDAKCVKCCMRRITKQYVESIQIELSQDRMYKALPVNN